MGVGDPSPRSQVPLSSAVHEGTPMEVEEHGGGEEGREEGQDAARTE